MEGAWREGAWREGGMEGGGTQRLESHLLQPIQTTVPIVLAQEVELRCHRRLGVVRFLPPLGKMLWLPHQVVRSLAKYPWSCPLHLNFNGAPYNLSINPSLDPLMAVPGPGPAMSRSELMEDNITSE